MDDAARARLSTVWKRRIGRLWRWSESFRSSGRPRTLVLLYHSVGADNYSVPVDLFERQMCFLAAHTSVVPLEDILTSGRPRNSITCAITWDDGYASVHEYALKILEKYKFPSTLYVTTGLIGEESAHISDEDRGLLPGRQMLTWSQIRGLQRSVFSIGAHLVHHLNLTALSREQALAELRSSRRTVQEHTDDGCLDFAYPWGLANRRCAEWVHEAGYRSAATVLHNPVPLNLDPLFVPRVNICRDYNLADFDAIIRGDWDYLAAVQRAKTRLGLARPVIASTDDGANPRSRVA
jgi:peptidoglycan/xylan/chitin deacetylase (PgdA/CDA1 family)